MKKQKIIILGGSGTIGSSIADEVLKNGFIPHLIGRNANTVKEVAKKLNCPYNVIDVLNIEDLKKYLEDIKEDVFGLVYCVGSIDIKPLHMAKESEFINSYKLNTIGAVTSIKSLLPNLKKNNGSILLFSSIAVQQGFANHSIISTAKGALEALTRSLAAELSPEIRVNCIAPSLTDSKMSQKMVSNETIRKAIENMHPIPKIGSGKDFADLASFLLGEKNNWITGQIFHIDGGRSTLRIKS